MEADSGYCLKKLPASLALSICSCCFALCALTEGKTDNFQSQLTVAEKRLQAYLEKRVLVFRKGEIERHQITFDSRGCPLTESGEELKLKANAILFVGLALDAERLVISGEAVHFRTGVSQLILSRDPRKFRLVTCTVILELPPEEISFAQIIGVLCKVFLTKEELVQNPVWLRCAEGNPLFLPTLVHF